MALDSLGPDALRNKVIDPVGGRAGRPTESLTDGPEEPVSKVVGPSAECDRQSLRAKVHRVLGDVEKQVPGHSYRILYMHWVEGCTMAEIAASLNLSIDQVWAGHQRAKHQFRCLFEVYQDFPAA
jgi:DNA-directed RNA polymerase specialized sigma24 family protein